MPKILSLGLICWFQNHMYLKKLFCIRQKKSEGYSFCHSIIYITDRQRNRKLWVLCKFCEDCVMNPFFNLHDSKFKGFCSTFALIKRIMEKSVDVKLAIFVEKMIEKRFPSFIYIRKSSLQENMRLSKLCTLTIPHKKLEKKTVSQLCLILRLFSDCSRNSSSL